MSKETKTSGSAEKNDQSSHEEPPYTIYTRKEKWAIVMLASCSGLFSPLTANIYFPAIPTIAEAFHKSTELINLTVTMYLVLQGISPMIFGTLADQVGRRMISIICLLILCLSCVGLALVPTNAYWLLMLLRVIQASGSASAVAIGAGIIGDIALPAERAGFFGTYTLFPVVGPAIGPVIGGALAGGLGWRAIFWFLCIGSAICALVLVLILPETLRAIAGNGSNQVKPIYHPIFPLIGRGRMYRDEKKDKNTALKIPNPFPMLKNLDIVILLFFSGVVCAVYYAITASISTLFQETYSFLNETTTGLCFLAIGGGLGFGTVFTGRLLDRDFQRIKRQWSENTGRTQESRKIADDLTFPLEKARLRLMPIFVVLFVIPCAGYGWCLQTRTSIAAPLVLQFIIGFAMNGVMNATQTLLIDLAPTQGSTITACNNFMRCSLGAAMVAAVDPIIQSLGVGWTYVLLAGLPTVLAPLMWVNLKIGPRWREKRKEKAEQALLPTAS